ncbi:hypothetical protein Tco_0823849 [Tanacetum coccineum]|uniref:Uncharacterized protein n=1 Tax=Tanacetum coccineum TaxID=301880 RepID=A0ABQ5AJ28_9ASTR
MGNQMKGSSIWVSYKSKAFRVYNLETKRVEENLHITFLENKPNVAGKGPTWLFDLDYLTNSMNYQPVRSENQANKHAGPQEANQNAGTENNIDAGDSEIEVESAQDYFVLPIWSSYTSTIKSSKVNNAAAKASSTNIVNTASTPVSTASPYGGLSFTDLTNTDQDDLEIHALEEIYDNPTDGIFTNSSYDNEAVQTRKQSDQKVLEHAFVKFIFQKQRRNNLKDFSSIVYFLVSCLKDTKKISEALKMNVGLMLMIGRMLQFKIRKFGILVDLLLTRNKANWNKRVYRNKKDDEWSYGFPVWQNLMRMVSVSQTSQGFIDPSILRRSTKYSESSSMVYSKSQSLVTPKNLPSIMMLKRIFRYLKGKPKLGLWYPKCPHLTGSSIQIVDHCGANLDRKSITGGCQFLGRRLISWQCKKQTIMATSTTEAEYVAAA